MPISRCDSAGFRLLLGLALVISTWLALTPRPIELPPDQLLDKAAHLLTFALLSLLVDASWPQRGFGVVKWAPLLAYGAAIELLQSQIPNRSAETADLVANALGIALYGFMLLRALRASGFR